MKREVPKVDPVYVEWVDSSGFSGWRDYTEYERDNTLDCTTVGHLIEEREDRVVLACSMACGKNNTRWNDIIEIPKVAIRKMRHLKKPAQARY